MGAMRGFRPATESEVVLAFLRGELNSERFGDAIRQALVDAGGLQLVQNPHLESVNENQARARALARARGWPDLELFEDFPRAVDWYHGVLPPQDLERVRFIDYSYWNALSGGSRRPCDVLPTLESGRLPRWLTQLGTHQHLEFACRLATADVLEHDLIVMATPDFSELVLLEGHARVTAIFVGGHQRRLIVRSYIGVSPDIRQWGCF